MLRLHILQRLCTERLGNKFLSRTPGSIYNFFFKKCIKCEHSEASYLFKGPLAYPLLVVSSLWVDENTLQLFLVLVNICCLIMVFFFFPKQLIQGMKDIRLSRLTGTSTSRKLKSPEGDSLCYFGMGESFQSNLISVLKTLHSNHALKRQLHT